MLEKIDLSREISKEEFKAQAGSLEIRLGELQRTARTLKIPLVLVFEGFDAAGKGTLINNLIQSLDPRGFKVHLTKTPETNEEMVLRPYLWRFWVKTPARGQIGIFDRSWHQRLLTERVEKTISGETWRRAFEDIVAFERQLADDGAVILKFWLQIDKKEQKKRLKKLDKDPTTNWRVSKADWKRHEQYDQYLDAAEEMIQKTDSAHAPWVIVESHDERFATLKVFRVVVEALEKKIAEVEARQKAGKSPAVPSKLDPVSVSILNSLDLNRALNAAEYDEKIKKYQERIRELEFEIYRKRIPVMVLYEGCDAAGKGGNIKRVCENLDPRGYNVTPIAAPSDVEKVHHYLWRFWNAIPKAGHIEIFDRTWYGRVLVERIEGFCSEADWKRAYREINEMERHLADFGTVLVKFWLHIDKEEQLRRFTERQNVAFKNFKITEEDWRNREKWDVYMAAIDEMFYRTSTPEAPWTIVEANDKRFARVKTLKTIIERIEAAL